MCVCMYACARARMRVCTQPTRTPILIKLSQGQVSVLSSQCSALILVGHSPGKHPHNLQNMIFEKLSVLFLKPSILWTKIGCGWHNEISRTSFLIWNFNWISHGMAKGSWSQQSHLIPRLRWDHHLVSINLQHSNLLDGEISTKDEKVHLH